RSHLSTAANYQNIPVETSQGAGQTLGRLAQNLFEVIHVANRANCRCHEGRSVVCARFPWREIVLKLPVYRLLASGILLRGESLHMRLRVMTESDLASGVRLNTLAGWNQTAGDWSRFLARSPRGCFVVEDGTKVVGTATTVCYEDRFAWIGMVLVDPEYRKQG